MKNGAFFGREVFSRRGGETERNEKGGDEKAR